MSIRKAFSLTELLIVLVILAVLFTAALPVVTKRKVTDYISDSVWNYVYADEQKDAYYHPGDDIGKDKSASAFIGMPGNRKSNQAKLVIRSSIKTKVNNRANSPELVQRHIQFRYGKDIGEFAGTLYADEYNMLLGANYSGLLSPDYINKYATNVQSSTGSDTDKVYNKYNTIMGISTGDNTDSDGNYVFKYLGRSVIIGNNSLSRIDQRDISEDDKEVALQGIIALGHNVYSKASKIVPDNIFIGNNSGGIASTSSATSKNNENNIAVGFNSLPYRNDNDKTEYQNNVFLGANTGEYFQRDSSSGDNNESVSRNVIIGSEYRSYDANDNVIIGHGAYENGDSVKASPDIKYLTAIGNGACESVESIDKSVPPYSRYPKAKFPRTCIGVNSAKYVNEGGVTYKKEGSTYKGLNIIAQNVVSSKYYGAYPQGDERIYIGSIDRSKSGKPEGSDEYTGGFGGRALLEIHNVPEPGRYEKKNKYNWRTGFASDASVILNTNLVVRGLFIQDLTSPYDTVAGEEGTFEANSIHNPFVSYLQRPIYYTLPFSSLRKSVIAEDQCTYYLNTSYRYNCATELGNLQYQASANAILYQQSKSTREMSTIGEVGPYDVLHGTVGLPNLRSDRRLKTDIVENNDGFEKLSKLKIYNYTFKKDPFGKPQVGVIAQELQEIFPDSVSKDKDGFLKIRWDEMFYAMINSIKEFGAKLEKIATSISDMEVSTITIKNQHKELRKEIAQLNARAARLERK